MVNNSRRQPEPQGTPLADSPWFWFSLFATAALIALIVVGPKYAQRQTRLLRMAETREQLLRSGEGNPSTADDESQALAYQPPTPAEAPSLNPLVMLLAVLLAAGAVGAGLVGYFRGAALRSAALQKSADRHAHDLAD